MLLRRERLFPLNVRHRPAEQVGGQLLLQEAAEVVGPAVDLLGGGERQQTVAVHLLETDVEV